MTRMPRLSAALVLQQGPWYAEQARQYGTRAAEAIALATTPSTIWPEMWQDVAVTSARLAYSYALDSINWREEEVS